MTTSTTGTSGNKEQVPYLHSTKKNYEDWKMGFDSTLSKHPDSLLTVVQDYKIAKGVLMKIRMQYKQLDEEWNITSSNEHLTEFNTKAWYIMMPTIQDTTMRKTLERKYGDKHDCHGAYEELAEHWNTSNASTTNDLIKKDNDRKLHIDAGAKSGGAEHMEDFVETLLEFNAELEDTDYRMPQTVLTNHFMNVLSKHDPAYVRAYKGAKAGDKDWNKNFDVNWQLIKKDLKDFDTVADANAKKERSDILSTETTKEPRDTAMEEILSVVKVLSTQVKELQKQRGGSSSSTYPPCDDCGFQHPGICVGKALSKGTMTIEAASKVFKKANDPAATAKHAQARYEEHQRKGAGDKTFVPRKSYNMVVTTSAVRPWEGHHRHRDHRQPPL